MRIVGILLSVGLGMWVVYSSHRRARESSQWWSLSFWTLAAAGFILGFWLAGRWYNETAQLRVIGYPFRVVVVEFTGGEWHGEPWYHNNRAALTADIAVGMLVFLLPFRGILLLVDRNNERRNRNLR